MICGSLFISCFLGQDGRVSINSFLSEAGTMSITRQDARRFNKAIGTVKEL